MGLTSDKEQISLNKQLLQIYRKKTNKPYRKIGEDEQAVHRKANTNDY